MTVCACLFVPVCDDAGDVQERDDSEQLVRELMRKTKKLQEEQSAAEQSLKVSACVVQLPRTKQNSVYLSPS